MPRKSVTIAVLLCTATLALAATFDIEQSCTTEAQRVWSTEQLADHDGTTRDGRDAQWWLAGCRAGARLALDAA